MPLNLPADGGKTWVFFVAHAPVEHNYAHTEVRTKPADQASSEAKKPSSPRVKKEMKARLASCIQLL
jgi:hypothetical protein